MLKLPPRIVIVEGPDNCGKSTLAYTLAKESGGIYCHASGDSALHPAMRAYQKSLLDMAVINNKLGRPVIFDRLWPSEWVYAHLFRRPMLDVDCKAFIDLCRDLKVTYVLCDRDNAVRSHSENRSDDHPYSNEQYKNIHSRYTEWMFMMKAKPETALLVHHLESHGQDKAGFNLLLQEMMSR